MVWIEVVDVQNVAPPKFVTRDVLNQTGLKHRAIVRPPRMGTNAVFSYQILAQRQHHHHHRHRTHPFSYSSQLSR
jgi:hypothetical protein